jgi:hypothetical protein
MSVNPNDFNTSGIELGAALIQLLASLGLITLALQIGKRQRQIVDSHEQEMRSLAEGISTLGPQIGALAPRAEHRQQESEEVRHYAQVLARCDKWMVIAERSGARALSPIQEAVQRLRSSLDRLQRSAPGLLNRDLSDEAEMATRKAVMMALERSDKDIDRTRTTHPELQRALRMLVESADMDMIEPVHGTKYTGHGSGLERKVNEVHTRGLRYKNGPVLRDAEFSELP